MRRNSNDRKKDKENNSSDEDKFIKDPLFYYNYEEIHELIEETEKAYLLKFNRLKTCWVPKALCKKFNKKNGSVFILRSFEMKPIRPLDKY